MTTLQKTFGLDATADRVQELSFGLERTRSGIEHDWAIDSGRFPEILQFLLDSEPPVSLVRGIGRVDERYGIKLFEFDPNDDRIKDFGGSLIELTNTLPNDAILVVGFDETTSVVMRMPQAPFDPFENPLLNSGVIGHVSVYHPVNNPPAWLEASVPADLK